MSTYNRYANSTTIITTKTIKDLSPSINFGFDKFEIRYYKGSDRNYFYASLAIPGKEDDQGFILEYSLLPVISNTNDDYQQNYEVSINDQTFEEMPTSTEYRWDIIHENKKMHLKFTLRIKGTAFHGYTYIDNNL